MLAWRRPEGADRRRKPGRARKVARRTGCEQAGQGQLWSRPSDHDVGREGVAALSLAHPEVAPQIAVRDVHRRLCEEQEVEDGLEFGLGVARERRRPPRVVGAAGL